MIVHLEKPKRNVDGNGGYSYEQKFHAPWERWTTRKLFYARQRGSEKAWSMTQKPEYFMQIVIDNLLAAGFGEFVAEIDASLTEMKLVQFDGDDIVAGLNKIAEAWETEWWIADDVIHLSKCEYGTPVGFEEGDLIRSMTRSDGQDNDYITRLYAFGSTRNIPTNYRKSEDEETVIEGIVERRLKLPEGTDHIDAWPNLREEDVVEGVAIFDEVYPRRTGKCEDITTEVYRDEVTDDEHPDGELVEWNAYRFKDSGIKFKSDYILPDEELRLTFQSGALAGMDFAVVFNPDGADESSPEAQVWEVVRNDTYGIDLPSDKFHPEEGDEYVLYGYDTKMVSDILMPRAEQELLEEAQKLLAKKCVDGSVYTCETDKIRCAGYTERKGELTYNPMYEVDLDVGQSIELRSDNYFSDTEGYRVSRVRAFEKRLDNKFAATYEVGETATYSKSKELDEKMESLTVQNTQVTALGGGVYLIKRYDGTAPSDHNAYSATRANAEFLHRGQPDVAQGLIKFLAGMEVGYYSKGVEGGKFDDEGNLEAHTAVIRTLAQIATAYVEQVGTEKFVDGFTGEGWQIWKAIATGDWNLTIDRLTVRKLMTVYEVLIQKIRAIGGQIVVSAGNGKVKEVQTDTEAGNYILTFEDENTFAVGDLVRCQTWTGADVKHYWVRVSATTADGIVVPISEFEGATPAEGDELVLMGSTDNPLRQNCVSISATEDGQPRVDVLNGIKEKNLDNCLRARLGNLDGITDSFFPTDNQPHGDGLYADNVYLRGSFLLSNGDDIKTRFEILEGRLKSEITAVEKQLNDYESYLRNAYFDNDMAGWETDNGVTFFLLGNKWIWVNDKPLANKTAYTGIAEDRNRTVLYIKNRYLIQRNENFESHPDCNETDIEGYKLPKTFYLSFFYRVLSPGTLKIEFENASKEGYKDFDMMTVEQELEATGDTYQTFETSGLWNGTGDFKLTFSGEIYLYAIRLSLDRIADVEQKYRTLFQQTTQQLELLAQADEQTTRMFEQLQAGLIIEAGGIKQFVEGKLTDLENGLTDWKSTIIQQTSDQISVIASRFNPDGSLKNTAGLLTTAMANNLFVFDGEGNIVSFIEQTASNIKIKASQIELEGAITANGNFKINLDGTVEATNGKFTGEINATRGQIGSLAIKNNNLIGYDDTGVQCVQIGVGALNGISSAFTEKSIQFSMTSSDGNAIDGWNGGIYSGEARRTGCYIDERKDDYAGTSEQERDTGIHAELIFDIETLPQRVYTARFDGYVETTRGTAPSAVGFQMSLYKQTNSGGWTNLKSWNVTDSQDQEEIDLPITEAGKYKLTISADFISYGLAQWYGTFGFIATAIFARYAADAVDGTCTTIAKDGFLCLQGNDRYMQFSKYEGFETRCGRYGIRVSSTGFEKMTNGAWTTWNP